MNRLSGILKKVIEYWALAGGLMLIFVVLVNAISLAGNIFIGQPIPGDFEVVEIGVAVAVFAFLPYCQVTDANVTADIFTSGVSKRTQAVLALIASLVALSFSAILLWRMYLGMLDYRKYEELTMVFQFPIWMAFVPVMVSLTLLIIACIITLAESGAEARDPHKSETQSATQ